MKLSSPPSFADWIISAKGKDLESLLVALGKKLTHLQLKNPQAEIESAFALTAKTPKELTYLFLTHLLYLKDTQNFFPATFKIKITPGEKFWRLETRLKGEIITSGNQLDPNRLGIDVKAVTLHQFTVEKTKGGWQAKVVLDV